MAMQVESKEVIQVLQDPQVLEDCVSAHILIEVGEDDEAVAFCKSILRTPSKTVTDLQTCAYLTVLLGLIDPESDKDIQLLKARGLWRRIQQKHEKPNGKSAETRQISSERNQALDEQMEAEIDEEIKRQIAAAQSPLQKKIDILENELMVNQCNVQELRDQLNAKQLQLDTLHADNKQQIQALQAENTLLRIKKTSSEDFTQSFVTEHAPPPATRSSKLPWFFSCFSAASDDSDAVVSSKSHARDSQNLRYSTAQEKMSTGSCSSCGQSLEPEERPMSDYEKLMMNGPILIRPGRPLAYINGEGEIIDTGATIDDLPAMIVPTSRLNEAASRASMFSARQSTML